MTAADKTNMIMEMQDLMREIVALDKNLSDKNSKKTNLKSPLLTDGAWGENTEESYKSILVKYNSGKYAPKDMTEALKFLGEIKKLLDAAKDKEAAEKTRQQDDSIGNQPKPESAITDDQAKEAFRGLLGSIQSGRIKLKAGGDNSVFKQRISRDWGAIIRAYNGPQGVVDAFYEELALTDSDKAQLVKINEEGLNGTSPVVGKINQKFLQAINTYIKPFGRALRTEKGMARVIKRRQQRRNSSLERLNILSKVAQRKEVARERLVKRAADTTNADFITEDIMRFYKKGADLANVNKKESHDIRYIAEIKLKLDLIKERNIKNAFDASKAFLMGFMNKKELTEWINFKEKDMYNALNFIPIHINKYNTIYPVNIDPQYRIAINELIANIKDIIIKSKTNDTNKNEPKIQEESNKNEPKIQDKSKAGTPGRPTTDPTARMRALFKGMNLPVDNATGWTETINNSFKDVYDAWKNMVGEEGKPDISDGWRQIAPQIGFSNDISGATDLVEIVSKTAWRNYTGTQQAQTPPPPPPVAADADSAYNDINRAKTKLTELFEKILSGSTKVDRVGIDLRNDTKIFKGVIRGLGGVMQAVEYVFSKVRFTSEQLAELTRMNFDSNQKIEINALSLVRNLFVNIRRKSTKGIGNNALNADNLSKAVEKWMAEQKQPAATPGAAKTVASISKSIEIRKAAARKKLGLQS